jgi:hypothetical protein
MAVDEITFNDKDMEITFPINLNVEGKDIKCKITSGWRSVYGDEGAIFQRATILTYVPSEKRGKVIEEISNKYEIEGEPAFPELG